MNKRNLITLIFAASGLLVLILDGKTAIAGTLEGIRICLCTLIPSLFPFSVLSILITFSVSSSGKLLKPLCKLCRIPEGSESLLFMGWLAGYPVGAQNVSTACRKGLLTKEDAQRMAVFANNSGPSFIFGVLGTVFSEKKLLILLWFIQILSSVLTGFLLPGGSDHSAKQEQVAAPSLLEAIRLAADGMLRVCSCVIFFRMILEFLNRWILWYLPPVAQVLLTGFLELSNGCIRLTEVPNIELRFITVSGMLGFGGLCVWLQTCAVCRNLDLSAYLPWKLVQGCIAAVIAVLICCDNLALQSILCVTLFACFFSHFLFIRKKSIAF